MNTLILTINPGAHSTKSGLFDGTDEIWSETVIHSDQELAACENIIDQLSLRCAAVEGLLERKGVRLVPGSLAAVVGRGGLMKPVPGGTYQVCERMRADLAEGVQGEHASNLGAGLAADIARQAGCQAFVVDPVAVDEMTPVARVSGYSSITRKSLSHALNSKAVAREASGHLGKEYKECNFIVVHLGSGVSVSAHEQGRMIDVNNANEEGPFGTERTGTLPVLQLTALVCEMAATGIRPRDIMRLFTRKGGLLSYQDKRDIRDVMAQADDGDEQAQLLMSAFTYQVAKEIGAMATVLQGRVDAILITGAMAQSERLMDMIVRRTDFIAPCRIFPGDRELSAMAAGAFRVITGQETARSYELEAMS